MSVKTENDNVHTEAQARTKWCPHVRYNGGNNRGANVFIKSNCIGSNCMMWLWVADECKGDYIDVPKDENFGYCGLNKSDTNWGLYDSVDRKVDNLTSLFVKFMQQVRAVDDMPDKPNA